MLKYLMVCYVKCSFLLLLLLIIFSLKALLWEQFQLEICPYLLFPHWGFFGIGISLSHGIFYQIIHYFNGFCKALVFKYRVYPLAIKKIAWRRQKITVNVCRFKIQISFYYNFCDRYRYIQKIIAVFHHLVLVFLLIIWNR